MKAILDKLTKHDTITIKLASGEEVVASFQEADDTSLSIDKPLALSPTPQGGVGLVPWIFSCKPGPTTININSVLALVETDSEVKYLYETSSKNFYRLSNRTYHRTRSNRTFRTSTS
jgi:hypothetical protein